MDDVQKSKIRMAHWIDHNNDHVQGYKEVAAILDKAGHSTAAGKIRRGIELIESANREFESAVTELSPEGEDVHAHGHGSHDHGHADEHPHEHSHEHSHEHPHGHYHHSHSHKHE